MSRHYTRPILVTPLTNSFSAYLGRFTFSAWGGLGAVLNFGLTTLRTPSLLAGHRRFAGMTAPPLSASVRMTTNRGVVPPVDGGSKRLAAIVASVGFSALFVFEVLLAAGAPLGDV